MSMHYQKGYATTACGYYVGATSMTSHHANVTCGTCIRSLAFRGITPCGNEDHRPRAAVAALSWPDGRFKDTTACGPCLRVQVLASIDGSHGELHPVLVTPIVPSPSPLAPERQEP
jgi:hypothetical protein